MKKIFNIVIDTIKKHDNIFVFIYFLFVLSVYIYAVPLYVSDELWNFSFIYKMTNGYEIYKDLNVIITPLFHYIGEIIFYIFGDNYLNFRIYNILIFDLLYTMIYNVFKKMKIKKRYSLTYTLILFYINRIAITVGANYNVLVLLFVIVGIYLELNENNKTITDITKGINIFCVFMSKQNIFIYYGIALFITYIIKLKNNKINIKNIFVTSIAFSIPVIIFTIYLKYNSSLNDFISYCFLGIYEFGNRNKSFEIQSICYIAMSALGIIVSIILLKIRKTDIEIKRVNYIFISFEILMVATIYPICNRHHTILGTLISMILLIYNLHNVFVKEFVKPNIMNIIAKIILIILTLYFIIFNIYYLYRYYNSKYINEDIKPYENIIVDNHMKRKIVTICNYINENERNGIDTKIISNEAQLYMNVLRKNNKDMDLPFLGNFGKKGEEGILIEIESLTKNTKVLISKENINEQESRKIRDYIIENFKKIGEIEDFYIYER